jgi:hypothetical protein
MNEKSTQAIELIRQAAREAAAAGELPAFLGALEAVRVEQADYFSAGLQQQVSIVFFARVQ